MRTIVFAVICLLSVLGTQPLHAGNLNPPGPPPLSGVATGYTLTDIYARISSGTVGSGFYSLRPTAGPGPTQVTLTQIYSSLPGGTITATDGSVKSGKSFIHRAGSALLFSTGTLMVHGLPDTGLTTIYNANDDASYVSGAQPSYTMYNYTGGALIETSNVNSSSITVDNQTGLMWLTNGNLNGPMNWEVAITWCENLNYAGYTDWRLPNAKELMSIVICYRANPSIDIGKFRNTTISYYWTSTTDASSTAEACLVFFLHGGTAITNKTSAYYVRAVRGGP